MLYYYHSFRWPPKFTFSNRQRPTDDDICSERTHSEGRQCDWREKEDQEGKRMERQWETKQTTGKAWGDGAAGQHRTGVWTCRTHMKSNHGTPDPVLHMHAHVCSTYIVHVWSTHTRPQNDHSAWIHHTSAAHTCVPAHWVTQRNWSITTLPHCIVVNRLIVKSRRDYKFVARGLIRSRARLWAEKDSISFLSPKPRQSCCFCSSSQWIL